MADLYKILGVEEDASPKVLKKAYRLKAKSLHPDVNQEDGAEENFQNLLQAYLILNDPEKRKIYDRGFEIPEVEIPNRQKYPPPHAFGRWQPFYNRPMGHQRDSKSVNIDYRDYARIARIAGIVTFLFASTFLIDFLFSTEYQGLTVTQLQSKSLITKKVDDLGIVIVHAGDFVFEKKKEINNELRLNDTVDLKKSVIYGYVKYKRQFSTKFESATILATIVRFAALLIYIASLAAIFNKEKLEVKFNAALIASFFSLALLAFVILT